MKGIIFFFSKDVLITVLQCGSLAVVEKKTVLGINILLEDYLTIRDITVTEK